jgi:hypothetical protein
MNPIEKREMTKGDYVEAYFWDIEKVKRLLRIIFLLESWPPREKRKRRMIARF